MTGRTFALLALGCGGACLIVVAVQLWFDLRIDADRASRGPVEAVYEDAVQRAVEKQPEPVHNVDQHPEVGGGEPVEAVYEDAVQRAVEEQPEPVHNVDQHPEVGGGERGQRGEHDLLPLISSPPTARQVLGMGAVTVLGTVLVAVGVVGLLLAAGIFTPAEATAARGGRSESFDSPVTTQGAVETPTKRPRPGRLPVVTSVDPDPTPGAAGPPATAPEGFSPESREHASNAKLTDNARSAGHHEGARGEKGTGLPPVHEPAEAHEEPGPVRRPAERRPDQVRELPVERDPEQPETAEAEVKTSPPPDTPPQPAPQTDELLAAWDDYRLNRDGHFNARGLQLVLDERGFEATVRGGDSVNAGGSVLIVETPSRQGHFYVLPHFAKSPRAVAKWFEDCSSRALTGTTERVQQIAEGRWTRTGKGYEMTRRGRVA